MSRWKKKDNFWHVVFKRLATPDTERHGNEIGLEKFWRFTAATRNYSTADNKNYLNRYFYCYRAAHQSVRQNSQL